MTPEPHAKTFTVLTEFPHDNLEIACDAKGCGWKAAFPGRISGAVQRSAELAWTAHLADVERGGAGA